LRAHGEEKEKAPDRCPTSNLPKERVPIRQW